MDPSLSRRFLWPPQSLPSVGQLEGRYLRHKQVCSSHARLSHEPHAPPCSDGRTVLDMCSFNCRSFLKNQQCLMLKHTFLSSGECHTCQQEARAKLAALLKLQHTDAQSTRKSCLSALFCWSPDWSPASFITGTAFDVFSNEVFSQLRSRAMRPVAAVSDFCDGHIPHVNFSRNLPNPFSIYPDVLDARRSLCLQQPRAFPPLPPSVGELPILGVAASRQAHAGALAASHHAVVRRATALQQTAAPVHRQRKKKPVKKGNPRGH